MRILEDRLGAGTVGSRVDIEVVGIPDILAVEGDRGILGKPVEDNRDIEHHQPAVVEDSSLVDILLEDIRKVAAVGNKVERLLGEVLLHSDSTIDLLAVGAPPSQPESVLST